MAVSWTTIPDSDVDAESPIDVDLMTSLRDNVTAAFQKASGAPVLANDYIGSDMVDKSIGSDGSQVITTLNTWTPSVGLYNFVSVSGTLIELFVSSAWRRAANPTDGNYLFCDGTNMRIYNPAGVSRTVYWQKMT